MWIKEPYDSKRHEQILEFFSLWCDYHIAKNTILVIEENNKKYLKYPLSVEKGVINYNIWDDLINSYGIDPDIYTEEEHELFTKSEEWQKCEIEIARDLIGIQMLNKLNQIAL